MRTSLCGRTSGVPPLLTPVGRTAVPVSASPPLRHLCLLLSRRSVSFSRLSLSLIPASRTRSPQSSMSRYGSSSSSSSSSRPVYSSGSGRPGGSSSSNGYGGSSSYNGGGGGSSYGGSSNGFGSGGYGGGGGGRGGYGSGYNRPRDIPVTAPGPITVKKDFYSSIDEGVSSRRSDREIEEYYATEQITLKGRSIPKPVLAFDDIKWPDRIIDAIKKEGYTKPTPIQAVGWPIALSGRDMVGIAQTGSGKTMGYVLPAFIHIDGQARDRRDWGPMVLILAPTRELAQQIQEVIQQFNHHRSVCVFGGASKGPQIRDIQRNRPMIVVATPGRLNDFLESGIISLSNISFLVLDEADRMLDMGFEPQIRKIIGQIQAPDRQTLMWSATWPKEVKSLADEFLREAVQLNVGALQLHANHNITQIVEVCDEFEKAQKLFALLTEVQAQESKENKTIIFAETKKKVDELTRNMRSNGWPAMCIHGDKSQQERDWVLREFKSGKAPILVATDVAARGLDVDDIKFVINYDYPNCSEDYVHRIGRTGRRDKLGTAYTFFTRDNGKQANDLIGVLREANQQINPKLFELSQRCGKFGGGGDRRRWGYAPRGDSRGGYGGGSSSGFGGGFKRPHDSSSSGGYGGAAKRQHTDSGRNGYSNGY